MLRKNGESRKARDGSRLLTTAIVLAALFAADRTVFVLRDRSGSLCAPTPEGSVVAETSTDSFKVAIPCFATGIRLREGNVYQFKVEDDVWHDGRWMADADGLRDVPGRLVIAGPSRRHVSQPWMKLMGRVGQTGIETFAIGSGLASYKAKRTGELFLYVNDAVIGLAPGRHWALPYYWSRGKNAGTARVTVSLVHGADDGR